MTYSLDEKLFEDKGKIIRIFGEEFLKTNKDKCQMIIRGKEYEIKEKIKKSELKQYGINEEEELEVILKGDGITDMSCMFWGCKSLVKLDLSSFDTKNVTSMRQMFYGCESLVKLDLLSFDTQNVISTEDMFIHCESLVKVIRKNFEKVKIISRAYLRRSKFAIIEV